MDSAARLTPDALLAHEAFVLRLSRSLVRDEAAAQDLAQETWLSALEHPPREGSLHAWLARVTRNHAINLSRGRGRREARERAAARNEALEVEATSAERLELQHGVVRAVLALDEPYRSVVIAVYYEGNAPGDVARARGVPASTVRAQLSRGLERLRVALDGEHGGDRRTWSAALLGLLERAGSRATSTTAAGGMGAVAAWMAAAAAVVALVAGWQVLVRNAEHEATRFVGVTPQATPAPAPAAGASQDARREAPAPVIVAQTSPGEVSASDANAPRALVERALWIKERVLSARTTVAPDLARHFAWTEGRIDVGVVRLTDNQVFEERLDLPWHAGGGSTWSFSERTHDARRFGQLRLEQQGLGVVSAGSGKGVVVDLGEGGLRGFAADPSEALRGLDEGQHALWELVARPIDANDPAQRLLLQQALRDLRLDDEVEPEEGHLYLVRGFRPRAFDVLALVEVLRVERESCTLAWLLVDSREVPDAQPAPPSNEAARAALVAQPDLEGQGEAALLAELARVESLLAEGVAAAGAGRATLIDKRSPLARSHAPEAEPWLYSFATQRHGKRSEQDVALEVGVYSMDFNVRSISWFLDLGAVELAVAERVAAERFGPAWSLLATATLPHFAPQAERVEVQVALERQGREAGLGDSVAGRVGHTYLVRSIFPGWHDQLVAFRLEQRAEDGDRIAWRVLRSWPVDRM